MKNIAYELPYDLLNLSMQFGKLRKFRKMSKLGGDIAWFPVFVPEIKLSR